MESAWRPTVTERPPLAGHASYLPKFRNDAVPLAVGIVPVAAVHRPNTNRVRAQRRRHIEGLSRFPVDCLAAEMEVRAKDRRVDITSSCRDCNSMTQISCPATNMVAAPYLYAIDCERRAERKHRFDWQVLRGNGRDTEPHRNTRWVRIDVTTSLISCVSGGEISSDIAIFIFKNPTMPDIRTRRWRALAS